MAKKKSLVPSSFMLFAAKINVEFDDAIMNDKQNYGESDYSRYQITLSTHHGQQPLSEDRIKDTFYHEKVHMILDSMKEHGLSQNERFVDTFSKLLRQSEETAEYD